MHSPGPYNEFHIVQQVAKGDPDAFRELYLLYRDKIYSFALRLTESPETAEDILQEVFIKLWIQRTDLPEIVNINAWIYRLAHNQALNGLKRLAKEASVTAVWSADHITPLASGDAMTIKNDTENILSLAIDQLPPQQKLIYQLSREKGLKYEEIAVQLKLSPLTVKKHMAQALKFLRKHLDQEHRFGQDMAVVLLIIYGLAD